LKQSEGVSCRKKMNECPYSPDQLIIDEKTLSAIASGSHPLAVGYCKKCKGIAFLCLSCQSWNRAFAQYCVQCGKRLEAKPEVWAMAYANNERTASLELKETDELDARFGFSNWSVKLGAVERSYGDIPSLLAVDGLIIYPNLPDKKLEIRDIVTGTGKIPTWDIPFTQPLNSSSTPVYYGLHLYYAIPGHIMRKSLFDGSTQIVSPGGETPHASIIPTPGCAPLIFESRLSGDEEPTPLALFVLQERLLFLNLKSGSPAWQAHGIPIPQDTPRSPVICDGKVILTSKHGRICELDMNQEPPKQNLLEPDGHCFSAPVVVNNRVYFEAVEGKTGQRKIGCYRPGERNVSYKNLNDEKVVDQNKYQTILTHPPLTNGHYLIFSDRYSEKMYLYMNEVIDSRALSSDERGKLVPHQSIVIGNRIYSASRYGLTIFDLMSKRSNTRSLTQIGHRPRPITRPVRYADRLFILCEDRLVCLNI